MSLTRAKAGNLTYKNDGTGAVVRTIKDKLGDTVSVKDFGAKGDGVTNDTAAFAAASAVITANGGGKLIIPEGTYIVGQQTFAGATGLGYAYRPDTIISIINCTKPVIIEGNGAILKLEGGQRFGSFDPVTGASHSPTMPFYDSDYTAQLGAMISITNCSNVTIKNLELDGNINNQIIGGQWGDTGRQLNARGIYDGENDTVLVENVYSHHHGLDGFETKRTVTTSTEPKYPHTYINCVSTYNGRQGISWTGGNSLTMIDCDLSHTGKNGVVASPPGAGIDIEPESSIGTNGTFINCRFYNNSGPGMLASTGPSSDCSFYNCQMIGTTFWSGWTIYPGYRFHDCEIVGAWVWPGGSTDPELAAKWFGCKFLMDPAASPNGTIYGPYMDLNASNNVLYQGCVFYAASGYVLPFSNSGEGGAIYDNCTFEQAGSGVFYTRGNFYGHCRLTHSGTWDNTGSTVFGQLYVNGVKNSINLPTISQISMYGNDGGSGKTSRMVSYYSPTDWATAVGGANVGDIVYTTAPVAGGTVGWICTTAGTPGTWKTFGTIAV